MTISQHADVRARQRGISNECITILTTYGRRRNRIGDAVEYSLDKRGIKVLQEIIDDKQLLDKLCHQVVICTKADVVITCYHRS